jgi:peptide deformylase
MALLEILEFPDPRLRKKASKITTFDTALKAMTDDMLETMYTAKGIGLAATQVNIHKAIVVLDISEDSSQPEVFINPEIVSLEGDDHEFEEGCLSVPGFREIVSRPRRVKIKAHSLNGESIIRECEDLLSVCIQHEMDHLDGKLFVDYLSSLKRQRIKKKLEKQHK